jgi:hypothetical protein
LPVTNRGQKLCKLLRVPAKVRPVLALVNPHSPHLSRYSPRRVRRKNPIIFAGWTLSWLFNWIVRSRIGVGGALRRTGLLASPQSSAFRSPRRDRLPNSKFRIHARRAVTAASTSSIAKRGSVDTKFVQR